MTGVFISNDRYYATCSNVVACALIAIVSCMAAAAASAAMAQRELARKNGANVQATILGLSPHVVIERRNITLV
jgi:hypothetical protein